mgnify:CR=1 FL=1
MWCNKSVFKLLLVAHLATQLIFIVGCGVDDPSPVPPVIRDVDLAEEVSFTATRSLFLKAEMVEKFSDDPVMRVELPDHSVVYRELLTSKIWKERLEGDVYVKAYDISDEEMNLVKALDLDTGWQPSGSPLQVRFSIVVSQGVVSSDMTGDLTVSCKVGNGSSTNAEVAWVGRENEGELKIEGGLEVTSKFRVNVGAYGYNLDWESEIPNLPNADWGTFNSTNFSPFVLGETVTSHDDIDSAQIGISPLDIGVFSINAGALIGGWASADLTGICLTGSCGEQVGMVTGNGECCQLRIKTNEGNEVQCNYDNDTRYRWVLDIRPNMRVKLDVFIYSKTWDLGISHIEHTLLDDTFKLKYNSPILDIDVSSLK